MVNAVQSAVNALFLAAAGNLAGTQQPVRLAGSAADVSANALKALLGPAGTTIGGCALQTFFPAFPANQDKLVAPPATNSENTASFLGLAFGVQNYTCTADNTWASAGALAELIDVSCLAAEPALFKALPRALFTIWRDLIPYSIGGLIDLLHVVDPPEILAQHYFVPNPNATAGAAALSPVWDFRSSGLERLRGDQDAFILGRGVASIPSPDDPEVDVPWLSVGQVQGGVAGRVFRMDTVGGQPPKKCNFGSDKELSVKYVSNYAFYAEKI